LGGGTGSRRDRGQDFEDIVQGPLAAVDGSQIEQQAAAIELVFEGIDGLFQGLLERPSSALEKEIAGVQSVGQSQQSQVDLLGHEGRSLLGVELRARGTGRPDYTSGRQRSPSMTARAASMLPEAVET